MTRRWLMRRRVVLPLALVLVSVPAYPCGGPGADTIDRPLVPVETFLNRIYCEDEFEHVTREQFRMLDPLRRQMADSVADVYGWAYVAGANSYSPYEAPDSVITRHDRELLGPVRAAIARGVYPEAAAAARSAVEAVLDQPAGLAVGYSEVLRTAVEFLDVAPRLTAADRDAAARYFAAGPASRTALGTSGLLPVVLRDALEVRALSRESAAAYADVHPRSPRAASLRFVGLQEAMRTGIPNGYAFNIKDSVPPARWAALESLHDDWLRRYASHPMADYVRLSRVRLNFFKGDGAAAWNALLGMYPRHRQRVLAEMRYLTQHQIHPPTLDDPRIDWPLRTALVAFDTVSEAQWNKYWRAADANATQPWAAAMQERLLYHAVVMAEPLKRLPSEFPKSTRAPTPLWASLRLVALLQVGDLPSAFAQADSTPDAAMDVEGIRARMHLMRGEWGRAIATLGANDPSGNYLLRVLAPWLVVDSLARSTLPLAMDARLARAGRLAAAGDWQSASRAAIGTGAERERAWARTATLAADMSRAGTLAFARWLRAERGQLFFGENTEWLRALNWRTYRLDSDSASDPKPDFDRRLPWTPAEEQRRISAHLESTTELYLALRAYAKWLDAADARTPGLAAVIREADVVYNRLINWDANNSNFWVTRLETSAEARSIRRAGALLKRR